MGSKKSPTSLWQWERWWVEDKTVELLCLSFLTLSLEEIPNKWSLAPQPWKNGVTPHGTSKNQDILDHHCPMPTLFLIDLWNFHIIFFQYISKKFQVFNPPPVWIFFWNTCSCHAAKVVIWLFGWNSPVHWAIPEKIQTGGVWWIYFSEKPLEFLNLLLYLWKFWRKQPFTPGNQKFCKIIVCHPLEIPRSKTKTQGNFTLVFL